MKLQKNISKNLNYLESYENRLRVRLPAHDNIEETVIWEQKMFIGTTSLVDKFDDLDVTDVISRKGSARENRPAGQL